MYKKSIYLIPLVLLMVGCGDTTEEKADGEGSIDLRTYLEKKDISKNYQLSTKNKEGKLHNNYFTEDITVSATKIERKILTITDTVTNISEKKLTNIESSSEGDISISYFRHVDVGEKLYTTDINKSEILKIGSQEIGIRTTLGDRSCSLKEQLKEFTNGSNAYNGDILKIKCTKDVTITTKVKDEFVGTVSYVNGTEDSIDVNYVYLKKDTGIISSINNDCFPKGANYVDDTADCTEGTKTYSYRYYLGN